MYLYTTVNLNVPLSIPVSLSISVCMNNSKRSELYTINIAID